MNAKTKTGAGPVHQRVRLAPEFAGAKFRPVTWHALTDDGCELKGYGAEGHTMTDQTTAPDGVVSSTELGGTTQIRVYRLDDCDWWAGESLAACLREARSQCGDDCYPEDPSIQHELSDQTMQAMRFTDEDGQERSFAEELNRRIAAGEEFPQMFASTEF